MFNPLVFNTTVAGITVRATLGRRRVILFAVPAIILIALTLVLRASHPATQWPDTVLGDFGFSVLLPFTALIIGTGVLGAEIDDGSTCWPRRCAARR
jgi:ABC-2 type transport system permease protein